MALLEHRPLIVRGNRALGLMLLEKQIITPEQLDTANEKLVENMELGEIRRASILHILLFEMQVLNEDAYLEALVEKSGLGLIDLRACQFRKFADLQPDFNACWATWTLPFDIVEDFYLLATAAFPSAPTQKFWQDKYPGKNLLWYITSIRSFQAAMEKLEQLKAESTKTAPAAKPATKSVTRPPHPPKKN
jgi:hypothetical protein